MKDSTSLYACMWQAVLFCIPCYLSSSLKYKIVLGILCVWKVRKYMYDNYRGCVLCACVPEGGVQCSGRRIGTLLAVEKLIDMPQADVFQQIQSQFERKSPRPFCHGSRTKVLARNDVHFISDLPDKWLVDYERRQGHRHSGFFAYNHLPYKTFGNLKHTDVYDLIGEQLEIAISKHHAYSHVRAPPTFLHDCAHQ